MQICHSKLADSCRDDLRSRNLKENYVNVEFGVLAVMTMKNYIFWVITPRSSVKITLAHEAGSRQNISRTSSGSNSNPHKTPT
jgi:hypothetical protein